MDAVIGREAARFPRVARSPAGSSEGPPGPGEAGVLVAAHGHGADATAASATVGVDTTEHRTRRLPGRPPGARSSAPATGPRPEGPPTGLVRRAWRQAGRGWAGPSGGRAGCGRRRRSP
ncbi:hypothetical protein C0Q97_21475 [Streptomyces albidoflavus]|nr:hypothetical protein C0Q97_21475 [Streptomyces albidoflavus]